MAVADGRAGGSGQGEGDGRQMRGLACSKMSSWDSIICLFLKHTLTKRSAQKLFQVIDTFHLYCQISAFSFEIPPSVVVSPLKYKGRLLD